MRDYLQTENGDLSVVDGVFQFGEATEKHMRDILLSRPGDIRTTPTLGVGVFDFLDDDDSDDLRAAVRRNFAFDGIEVVTIELLNNGELKVNGYYNNG